MKSTFLARVFGLLVALAFNVSAWAQTGTLPVISSVSPASAAVGSVVTLSGTDLAGATAVSFGGVAATFTYDAGAQTISATIPANARSGLIQVTTSAGVSAGFAYTIPLTIVSQPRHSIVTGGLAASLSVSAAGGAQGATYTFQWRKNGLPISGAIFPSFYVPGMNETHEAEYDVVVSDGFSTVTSNATTLRLANPDAWTWYNRLPTANDFSAVAFGAGRYVAVGYSGTIVTSTDGVAWELQQQRPPAAFYNVTFAADQFVIVGSDGNVLRSPDGLSWTLHNTGQPPSLFGITHAHGLWVAAGANGAIFTSTDAITWTRRPVSYNGTINLVRALEAGFIAVGAGGTVLKSDSNGVTWTVTNAAFGAGEEVYDIAHANGIYVAAARTKVFSSTDATAWTPIAAPTTDVGIDWNRIVVTADGFTVAGASYVTTSPTPKGYIISSSNGTTWTLKTTPLSPGLQGIVYGTAGYVAVGLVGQIHHSADGTAWASVTTGPAMPGDLFAGATGPSGTVFAGNGGNAFRSTNHLTNWTRISVGTGDSLYAGTYAAGKYVFVGGNDGTTAAAAYAVSSATGEANTWTKVDITGTGYLGALAYDARVGRFVAAGAGGIYWAADPAGAWTAVTRPGTAVIRAATAANGKYVLVGDAGTVLYSTDGATWTSAGSGTSVSLSAIAYGNGRFVAAGANTAANAARTVMITSTDGITWQPVPLPYTGTIRGIMFADGRFITVGGTTTILESQDGLSWNAETSQFSQLLRAPLRSPEGYLIGGTGGAIIGIPAPKTTVAVPSTSIIAGDAVSFTPVTGTAGHAPYTYVAGPALANGLTIHPTTGAISGVATNAAAPFAGIDNLDSGSDAKWAYFFRTSGAGNPGNGLLGFTNGRLDFTKGTGAGSYFLGWDGDPISAGSRTTASYATSWTYEATVTNAFAPATDEFGAIGIEVAGGNGQHLALTLVTRQGIRVVRAVGTGLAPVETPITSTGPTKLRFSWDAATQVITAAYSTDAGATYAPVTTYSPVAVWSPGAAQAGFFFELFGESNAAAAISAGALSADDVVIAQTKPTTTVHTITVTDDFGLKTSASFSLTVVPGPSITSVSPTAPAVGATVTISGANFSNVSAVKFNGVAATSFTVVSDTQITAVAPAVSGSGPITVHTSGGSSASTSSPVVVLAPPSIIDVPMDRRVAAGATVEWRVAASGSAPLTYEWLKDDTVITGATAATLKLSRVTADNAGTYTVRVSNTVSSATSSGAVLTVLPPDALLWNQFTEFSTENSPNRTVHAGGKVYILGSTFDRVPNVAGGRYVGALARFNEADGTLDTTFQLDGRFRGASFLAVQPDGKLVIAVRSGDSYSVIRTSAAGELDTTFTAPLFGRGIRFLTLQSDGRILVAAVDSADANAPASALGTAAPSVHRLNSDGTLDSSFTAVSLPLGSNLFALPVVDTSGKIYLAGAFGAVNGTSRINIARINVDGTLDAAYAAPASLPSGFAGAQARAVLLQSDGRAVFVGDFRHSARGTQADPIMAIRLSTTGTLDTTFTMPLRSEVGLGAAGVRLRAAVLNTDDTIVAVSDRLVRLTANGALDTSFAIRGFDRETFWVSRGTDDRLYVPDIGGVMGQVVMQPVSSNGLAVFAANGAPDFSFQTGGWGRTAHPTDHALLSDGRVWLAGTFNRFGSTQAAGLVQFSATGTATTSSVASTRSMTYATIAGTTGDRIYAILASSSNSTEPSMTTLNRVLANGTLDATFAPALPSGYDLNAASLRAAPSGGVFLSQGVITPFAAINGTTGNALIRLNSDGARDTTFTATLSSVAVVERNASNAITMIRIGGLNIAQVLPDGSLLVIASSVDGNLRLLKLTATGAIDTSFNAPSFGTIAPSVAFTSVMTDPVTGQSGQFNLSTYSAADLVRTAVQTPDGKVYVGGRFNLSGSPRGLIRLNADGSLDTSFTGVGIATTAAHAGPYVSSLEVDSAGRVYAAGRFETFNGTTTPGIFRLKSDGSLDAGWSAGFGVLDVPIATVRLSVAGEKLYAFGTVGSGSSPLPSLYAIGDIPLPLALTQVPVATTAVAGTPVSLSVTATSTSVITYQWFKGTAAISGATSATYTIASPVLADEGLYSVTLSNLAGTVTTTPVQLTVNSGPQITQQPANTAVILGSPLALTVTATGRPAVTYQWFKGTTSIPGATTATYSVAAARSSDAGGYSVRVTNSVGSVTSAAVTVTVNPVAPVITSPLNASAISGRGFQYVLTTNATPVALGTGALPAGLTFDPSTGILSGTPSVTGTFGITLTAANVTATDTKTLTLSITAQPPVINSAASASARVGVAFSYTILAGNSPTSFSASGLPSGLQVNTTTGTISGTPSSYGTFAIILGATNEGGTSTSPFFLTVEPALNAPAFTGSTQLSGVQNSAFNFTPAFNTAGLTTTYTATGLPAGLSINASTGAITGTPGATGTFTIRVTATNFGGSATVPFTFTVNPPPSAPTITSASSASGTAGSAFSFALTASSAPATFNATGLPALGLSLNATSGVISGTPTNAGTLTVQVSAANNVGTGPQAALVITINPSPNAPILNNSSVAQGRVGEAFTFELTASNTPTGFAVTNGSLPAGLTLNGTTGQVAGTPTQVGQFPVWVAASNGSGSGYAMQLLFSIAPASTTPVITSNGTATGQVGQPFSYQIAATNSPTGFTATGLPAWLALNATTGVISGIPSEATSEPVSVILVATNGGGSSTPRTLLLSIDPAPATPVITSALTAGGQVGSEFAYRITATESANSFVALNLPAGLSLNSSTGGISGNPTTSGVHSVTLRAANAAGLGAPSTLVVNVVPAPSAPAITSAAAVSGKVGTAFTYTTTTTGTATGFTLSGTLPLGLALNTSTGVISGNPAASGVYTVELTATGAGGTSLPQAFVLNIAPADNVPVITSPIYAVATVGQDFNYQITAASVPAFAAAPFPAPFTLDAANLPSGLAVNPSTGLIQGRPTESGIFTASLVGTNSAGTGPLRNLTVFIAPAPMAPTVTSSTFAAAQVGVPFSYQIGGTNTPTSYNVTGAPAWMSTDAVSGSIAGTPTTPGSLNVQLVAVNAAGSSSPVTLTLTIAPSANAPVITSSRTASGTVSQPFTYTVTAAVPSGAPPVTAYVATGLPAGLSLDPATGVIGGTPVASGQFEVRLTAKNSVGDSQPVTLILTIQPSLQFNIGS